MRAARVAALALAAGCLQSPPSAGGGDGPPAPDAGTNCPDGSDKCMVGSNGHLYAVFSEHLVWSDAALRCDEIGGYLATERAEEESGIIEVLSSSPMWIGLTDAENEGVWTWITGESFDYTHWRGGEPSDEAGENCVVANWSQQGWNDIDCATDWSYVCELDG